MRIDIPIATEEEVRARNLACKQPIKDAERINEWLERNSELQQQAFLDGFDPQPDLLCYDEEFSFNSLLNCVTSTVWKGRVGRQQSFIVKDSNYGFTYGLLGFSSPILNCKITPILKEKYGKIDFGMFNEGFLEMSVCVGMGMLTRYLTGKLLAYIGISDLVVVVWDWRYGTDIKYIFTTSLYGKSSIYNRIKGLKYLGLSEGYNALFTKEEIAWIKREYALQFPGRMQKKTAKAPHLMRLYEHLYTLRNGNMPFYPLRTQRGVYLWDSGFGHYVDNIDLWKKRWYFPRVERLRDTT